MATRNRPLGWIDAPPVCTLLAERVENFPDGATPILRERHPESVRRTRVVGKTSPDTGRRTRPKDRRARIAAAAAVAFAERGYHGVSVEDIATEVGVTKSALYRHFPGKYALFLNSALMLIDSLEGALDSVPDDPARDPRETLRAQMSAIIAVTVEQRRSAGIYRWERRYLRKEDRPAIRERSWAVNARIRRPLHQIRPDLSDEDAFVLVAAMLSTIGSITVHNLTLPPRYMEQLVLDACTALAETRFSPAPAAPERVAAADRPGQDNMRENLLRSAVGLFHQRGYNEVAVEDIAATVGLPASGIYRYFVSKSDILAAAFHRAADRLETAVAAGTAAASDPEDALRSLVSIYVDLSFSQRELMSVYFAELVNVPDASRADLRLRQRANVEQWSSYLQAICDGLSAADARFLMYAAINLVPDLGVLLGTSAAQQQAENIHRCMLAVLLSRSGQRLGHGEDAPCTPTIGSAH